MVDHVPTTTLLDDIYEKDAVAAQRKRWEQMLAKFEVRYGHPAQFVSRSPGRVSIIGEHIDYSLYEVLPMAVTADILLAVYVHPPSTEGRARVNIANVNSSKFGPSNFDVPTEGDISIDPEAHDWSNYFKAGLRGALSLLRRKGKDDGPLLPRGMDILLDGTIPSGAGLSSSAAFVCASALAVMKANGEQAVDKTELVELAIVSERAVGVHSGGMDQAASVFAERGSALHVTFQPSLSARPVRLPSTDPAMVFVVAQSFVAADKHVTAPVCYNLRVVECALAAEVLAKKLDVKTLPNDTGPLEVSLRGLQDAFFERNSDASSSQPEERSPIDELRKMVNLTKEHLPQSEGYTREAICEILGISVDSLNKRYMSKFAVRADHFKVQQRALHVFEEAVRVREFEAILTGQSMSPDQVPQQLGSLMNATQDSCRDLYECSCPELDELCSIARAAGAYGSRLTGAGWGGCSVHLVAEDKVDAVRKVWIEQYYKKKFPDITEARLAEAIVVSKPGSGSCIFEVTGSTVT